MFSYTQYCIILFIFYFTTLLSCVLPSLKIHKMAGISSNYIYCNTEPISAQKEDKGELHSERIFLDIIILVYKVNYARIDLL